MPWSLAWKHGENCDSISCQTLQAGLTLATVQDAQLWETRKTWDETATYDYDGIRLEWNKEGINTTWSWLDRSDKRIGFTMCQIRI